MKSYSASININAAAERIWAILTDTAGYPGWDPGMDRIEGQLALGESVKFFTKLSPERAFPVKVTAFEPGKKMVLTGGMPLGLFKSERTHSLTTGSDGQTHFQTSETFSGPLLGVFGRSIPDLTESFENFAAGLKAEAEKDSAQ